MSNAIFEQSRSAHSGAADLIALQANIPVRLIQTPRRKFVRCQESQLVSDALELAREGGFDHLPVTNSEGLIIGLLDMGLAAQSHDGVVAGDLMRKLDENLVIGADASLIEFVEDADERSLRFVVDGHAISGLIALSDMQRLPVRAALFAMITQLEMLMAEVIRSRCADEEWIDLLTRRRRKQLLETLEKTQRDSNQVEPILYTQFCDKATIVRKAGWLPDGLGAQRAKGQLSRIEQLRNSIAHGNDFAQSRKDAMDVCVRVRDMKLWLSRLAQEL